MALPSLGDFWPSSLQKPRTSHVILSSDHLSCSAASATDQGYRPGRVCLLKANKPVPTNVVAFYFEVDIVCRGDEGQIAIGFVPSHQKDGSEHNTPPVGMSADSYGINGQGQLWNSSTPEAELSAPFASRDVIGAGVIPGKKQIFLTKNGKLLSETAFKNITQQVLYPAVSLSGRSEAVKLNFGQRQFQFNFKDLVQEEWHNIQKQIQNVSIKDAVLHSIVRDYLVGHAHTDTLAVFDRSYAQRALNPHSAPLGPMPAAQPQQEQEPTHEADIRKQVGQAITSGQTHSALALLEERFPGVLSQVGGIAPLYICCQCFVDKLLAGDVRGALQFGRDRLRHFQHGQSLEPHEAQLLRDTLALLAYTDPSQAPMKYLISDEHRRKVARVINAAILFHLKEQHRDTSVQEGDAAATEGDEVGGELHGLKRPRAHSALAAPSFLERQLQQLQVVHGELGMLSGPQGSEFDVCEELKKMY
eukprot:jgi/Ulvmu1/8062/UM004_0299.1